MTPVEDNIIKGCLAGNRAAFQLLYDTYAAKMFGVCIRYTKNREDAEDILQESFVKVFDNLKQFKKKGSFEGWIRKIMVNTALYHYRNNSNLYAVTSIEEAGTEVISEEVVFSQIETNDLLKMVQTLPPAYRTVFNLYVIEGYSHKEIAALLGVSEGTSKSNLSDARKRLRKVIASNLAITQKKHG